MTAQEALAWAAMLVPEKHKATVAGALMQAERDGRRRALEQRRDALDDELRKVRTAIGDLDLLHHRLHEGG